MISLIHIYNNHYIHVCISSIDVFLLSYIILVQLLRQTLGSRHVLLQREERVSPPHHAAKHSTPPLPRWQGHAKSEVRRYTHRKRRIEFVREWSRTSSTMTMTKNKSPRGIMWSAIPVALLCMIVNQSERKQGSGPEGDEVL